MNVEANRFVYASMEEALAVRHPRRTALRGAGLTLAVTVFGGQAAIAHARQGTPEAPGPELGATWYAAVRRAQVLEGVSSDEVFRVVRETFLPIVTTIPGFVAYYGIETEERTHVTISIFSEPDGPAESNRRSAAWAPDAIGELVALPTEVIGEGIVQVAVSSPDISEATPAA